MSEKERNIYATFLDQEKADDTTDWEALCIVMKMYGASGKLLNGVKAFTDKLMHV